MTGEEAPRLDELVPDAAAAGAAERTGAARQRDGAHGAAARALLEAAHLSPTAADRSRRLALAATAAQAAGATAAAGRLRDASRAARPAARAEIDLRNDLDLLSPAEQRVVGLVVRGARNKEVADALELSARTVESHLARAFRKLGVRSRTELVTRVLARP